MLTPRVVAVPESSACPLARKPATHLRPGEGDGATKVSSPRPVRFPKAQFRRGPAPCMFPDSRLKAPRLKRLRALLLASNRFFVKPACRLIEVVFWVGSADLPARVATPEEGPAQVVLRQHPRTRFCGTKTASQECRFFNNIGRIAV